MKFENSYSYKRFKIYQEPCTYAWKIRTETGSVMTISFNTNLEAEKFIDSLIKIK